MTGRQPSGPPPEHPSLVAAGLAGVYYLTHAPAWIARVVETVAFESERSGRRSLTVDLRLPPKEASVEILDGEYLYYVPYALLERPRLTAEIDVRSADGASLPLLTREENTDIAWEAMSELFNAQGWTYPGFADDLQGLLLDEDDDDYGLNEGVSAALLTSAVDSRCAHAARVRRVITDLAGNSLLWMPLRGRPGDRQLVKLSYPIHVHDPLLVYKLRNTEAVIKDEHLGDVTIPLELEDRLDWQRTAAACVNRVASTLGLSPYRMKVGFPQVRGGESYHLQVVAPPGVEIAGIQCEPSSDEVRVGDNGDARDTRRAHLYIKNISGLVPERVTWSFRPERRGFLNWALVAATLASTGLWFAQSHVPPSSAETDRQIAAAVLLVLPALLVVLVVRQSEHPIVTRLLAGVRALVVATGLASVAAAGAVAGFRPGQWQQVSEAWIWCASLATFATIGIALAWVVSHDRFADILDVTGECSQLRFVARVLTSGIAGAAALEAVRRNVVGLGEAEPVASTLLLLIAAATAVGGVANTREPVRFVRVVSVFMLLVLLVAAGAMIFLGAETRTDVLQAAIIAVGLLLAALGIKYARATSD